MVRKTKGLSLLATSLIIIAVAVIIAVGAWGYNQSYKQTSSQLNPNEQNHTVIYNPSQVGAQLSLISYSLTGSNPIYNMRLVIKSSLQKSLLLKKIEVIAEYKNGSTAHFILVPHGNQWVLCTSSHHYETVSMDNTIVINTNSNTVIVYTSPPIYVNPYNNSIVTISLIAVKPLTEANVQLYLQTHSGQIYVVNSNSIKLVIHRL